MNKVLIKKILARTVSPFFKLSGARIVYFHSIHPSHEYANTPDTFNKMIAKIPSLGRTTLTMKDLTAKIQNNEINNDMVAITFDDGYVDNYKYAFPALKELNLTATFYVIAGLIDNGSMKTTRRIYDGLDMMTREQLIEMSDAGMEIGSHTWSHYAFKDADKKTVKYELETSKKFLEDLLGKEVNSFCYPNGEVPVSIPEEELYDLFRELGYTNVTTTVWGCVNNQSNALSLDRQIVDPYDTPEDFAAKLNGKYDYMRKMQQIRK